MNSKFFIALILVYSSQLFCMDEPSKNTVNDSPLHKPPNPIELEIYPTSDEDLGSATPHQMMPRAIIRCLAHDNLRKDNIKEDGAP